MCYSAAPALCGNTCAGERTIADTSTPQAMSAQTTHIDGALPLSKRRRVTRACDNCKSRKRRCNGEKPCAYCTEHREITCTYDAPYTRGKSDHNLSTASKDTSKSPLTNLPRWPNQTIKPLAAPPPSNNAATVLDGSNRWPSNSLNQIMATNCDEDEPSGILSSRARSPVGGDPAAPSGQYIGPTSPFSVSQQAGSGRGLH